MAIENKFLSESNKPNRNQTRPYPYQSSPGRFGRFGSRADGYSAASPADSLNGIRRARRQPQPSAGFLGILQSDACGRVLAMQICRLDITRRGVELLVAQLFLDQVASHVIHRG